MKAFGDIFKYLFPRKCIFCRKEVAGNGKISICIDCLMTLTSEGGYTRILDDGRECKYALRYSAKGVNGAIIRFKFNNRPQYADIFGELIYDAVKEYEEADIISYVPVSFLRKLKRGYDQSKLLAEYVAKRMNKDSKPTLIKIRHNRKQSTLDETEKQKNVKGAYKAIDANVKGKRIILIDDVVTTGSTIMECGKTLIGAGAKKIIYAAAASAGNSKSNVNNR